LKDGRNLNKLKGRIALLHYTGPPYIGGVEKVIEKQGIFLRERGFDVILIIGKGGKFREDITFHIIPEIDSSHPENLEITKMLKEGKVPKEFTFFVNRIEKKLETVLENVDVLIVHNLFTMPFNLATTYALKNLRRIPNLKIVAWCHDAAYLDPTYKLPTPLEEPWSILREKIDGITYVTISEWRRKGLANLFGVDKEEITVIPNGIDLFELWQLKEEKFRKFIEERNLLSRDILFFFPTRMVKRKNIEIAIEIIYVLKRIGRDPCLLITAPHDPHNIESRNYQLTLKEKAKSLGVEDGVIFLSEHFPIKNVLPFFLMADALLFPSKMEGFGIPLLEAGALHIPILSSSIPPFKEIAEEREVYFFNPDASVETIAQEIIIYLEKHPGFNFHRKVRKEYNWEQLLKNYFLPLVEELLKVHH